MKSIMELYRGNYGLYFRFLGQICGTDIGLADLGSSFGAACRSKPRPRMKHRSRRLHRAISARELISPSPVFALRKKAMWLRSV